MKTKLKRKQGQAHRRRSGQALRHRSGQALRHRSGQAMVEYIIIVAVVAVAALVIVGIFGDTIIEKFAGASSALDSDSTAADHVEEGQSLRSFRDMDEEGLDN